MKENYRENYEKTILMQIDGMNQQDSIEHIKDLIFNIEMIDRWQEEDKIAYDVLCKILKDLQMGVKP